MYLIEAVLTCTHNLCLYKTYIVGTLYNSLIEPVLMCTHSLYFTAKSKKNNVYPRKPQFYYKRWDLGGSKLLGVRASVLFVITGYSFCIKQVK